MLDIRRRREVLPGPAIRHTWLPGLLAVVAAAVLGAAVLQDGSPGAAADTARSHAARQVASGTVLSGAHGAAISDAVADDGAPLASAAAATAPGNAAPGATAGIAGPDAARTTSLDAPIQGGLSVHQAQALAAKLMRTHRDAHVAPRSQYWTPAMGRTAVARAQSWLKMPYSWAAGDAAGPTLGRCNPGTGGDLDCHFSGFDCSGLMMYAWGSYLSLPHLASAQVGAGAFHPTVKQLLPGDLVFFAGYIPGGIGHVAIYAGKGTVIEAPQSGATVQRASLAGLIAGDTYRGAVRPMTGPTPELVTTRLSAKPAGGLETLHGTHLTNADAVHVDGVTVTRFARHTDSVITFRAPRHARGTVPVTVSTAWHARSRPAALIYAKARHRVPVGKPSNPDPQPSSGSHPPKAPTAPHSSHAPTAPTSTPAPSSSPAPAPTSTPAPSSSPAPTSTSAPAPGSTSTHRAAAPQATTSSSSSG